MTVHWGSTLLKMLRSDPRHPPGIGDSLIKLFLAGNSSGISGFPEIFRSWSGKNFPSAKNSRPGRVLSVTAQAGDGDHSLINTFNIGQNYKHQTV
jgi:hypothetical protein